LDRARALLAPEGWEKARKSPVCIEREGERERTPAIIAAVVPLNRVPLGIDKLIDASRVAGNLAVE
jgi:hypothetical protein